MMKKQHVFQIAGAGVVLGICGFLWAYSPVSGLCPEGFRSVDTYHIKLTSPPVTSGSAWDRTWDWAPKETRARTGAVLVVLLAYSIAALILTRWRKEETASAKVRTRIIRAIVGFLLAVVAEIGAVIVNELFGVNAIDSHDQNMVGVGFLVLLAIMLRGIWKWALVDFALSLGLTAVVFLALSCLHGDFEDLITVILRIGVAWFIGYGLGSPLLLLRRAREVRNVGTSPPP